VPLGSPVSPVLAVTDPRIPGTWLGLGSRQHHLGGRQRAALKSLPEHLLLSPVFLLFRGEFTQISAWDGFLSSGGTGFVPIAYTSSQDVSILVQPPACLLPWPAAPKVPLQGSCIFIGGSSGPAHPQFYLLLSLGPQQWFWTFPPPKGVILPNYAGVIWAHKVTC